MAAPPGSESTEARETRGSAPPDDAFERYDRTYFDHWYRQDDFGDPVRLDRKARYAIGAAQYLLDRPVRSVLDVGCGEGAWSAAVRRLCPGAAYVGVDPSAYAIRRFGRRRNLRLGSITGLAEMDFSDLDLGPDDSFDLIVCSDVIGYVPTPELRVGLCAISALLGGVALIEVFTAEDDFEGDVEHYLRRPARTYARLAGDAGLRRIGPHLYAGERALPVLATLER